MKKLLLSAFGFAVMMTSINAQTYFSDDFTGGIGNWSSVEAAPDTDTKLWKASNEAAWNNHQGYLAIAGLGEFAISKSWTQADGGLTPNNFLISANPIDLTTVTQGTNINLSWSMGSIEINPWYAETYSIYVTTSNTPATIVAATPVLTGTLANPSQIDVFSVNLDAFAGQSVYLTFRHHNTFDMNMIVVDNVVIKTLPNNDATITSLGAAPYAAGNTNITGVITNSGVSPITSMDITWNDGSGPNTDNLTGLNIASGATYNFTHSIALAVTVGTYYSINVDVALTGDTNMADNSLSTNFEGLTQIPAKVVVGEERTGTWCGWCPRGAVALSGMEATSSFIGIAIHNQDPMTVNAYDANLSLPGDGSYPHGAVDRVIGGDPSTFSTMHAQRVNAIVPCAVNNIVATYDQATSQISVSADAEFFGDVTGTFRMSCVIVEDDIQTTGSGWNQSNSYAGGGGGPLTDPVSGFDWAAAANPVVPTAFGGYDHVAVSLSNNDVLGDAGSLTTNPTIGTQSY
ncbi:MAG: hypothetical protein HRT71_02030, partial [Flavobacteriales bacterium]|nr:hypothetical protein [Flavobacteriales bacterium]